jgi:hypothetical protein
MNVGDFGNVRCKSGQFAISPATELQTQLNEDGAKALLEFPQRTRASKKCIRQASSWFLFFS